MFKIDYYNVTLSGHSPDATDPAVTRRVLTILLRVFIALGAPRFHHPGGAQRPPGGLQFARCTTDGGASVD